MNRILIIQTAFLGDVILATAVVNEANRLFPDAQIDFLVKKGNETLLANNPKINAVFTLDKSFGKLREIRRLTHEFRSKKYDIVFNFHRFGSSGMITVLSGAKIKYGFKKNPLSRFFTKRFEHTIGDGTHEVTRNLSMLKEFGSKDTARPELFPSADDYEKVTSYQQESYICMAPASVWFTKQLPVHKWIELIQLQDANKTIYLLGAPTDALLCDEIISKITQKEKKVINLAGKLTLLQSAALIEKAAHTYVNDSGPLHIASAMNAPITAFFCSTVPDFGFGPLSDDSTIKEVKNLECKPCGLHGYKACPLGHFKCGEIDLK